jgi:hypothetical protein
MAKQLAQPAGAEMPGIARSGLLSMIGLGQLADGHPNLASQARYLLRPGTTLVRNLFVGVGRTVPHSHCHAAAEYTSAQPISRLLRGLLHRKDLKHA